MTSSSPLTVATTVLPVGDGGPYGIVAGPDGALWFTLVHGSRIGRMTPGGELATFPSTPRSPDRW